ncbi:Sec7 domain-containing protein [Histoplasma capsulatum H143]|uniref:Sec7 domain-containing protein n=1 Tax=Ajellomyces capsulatus (strain H143) TaxID=544712 RepID=C6H921_AJECH|nr:Sec7 domain-containing protein [Histoplasma capsulatum H143]
MAFEHPRPQKRAIPAYPSSSRAPQMYDTYSGEPPPRTPPPQSNKYKTMRKGDWMLQPPIRQTFLDDFPPVDNHGNPDSEEDDHDTHDLSLSPKHVTRTSVVDNMLLSLDQFSVSDPHDNSRLFGSSRDQETHPIYTRYSSMRTSRPRGDTFSSSISSDIEVHSEDNVGRYSSQSTRGRRSNSNSNYHPGLRRIDSVRGVGESMSTRNKTYDAQRGSNIADRPPTHRTSRVGTKTSSRSSGSSSVDFNQMTAGGRLGQYTERRSASFDYGSTLPPSQPLMDNRGGFEDFIHYNGFHYDDIDAAPTPCIPVGPRRNISPPMRELAYNRTAPSSSRGPALSRKRSSKSARSMYTKNGRSDTLGTATIRGRGNESRHHRDPIPDFPPSMPTYSLHQPAPSPTIAFHKSAYDSPQPVINNTPPPPTPKERPGFFRRVFGGGSSKSQPLSRSEVSASYNQENETPRQQREQHHSAPNSSKGQKQSIKEYSSPGNNVSSRENTPVITKKPSSFFRRRKKSIPDHVPPPLKLSLCSSKPEHFKVDHLRGDLGPEPSPVSSLRKVMDPYLTNTSSHEVDHDPAMDDADNEVSGGEQPSLADFKHDPAEVMSNEMMSANPENNSGTQKPRMLNSLNFKSGLNLNVSSHDRDDSFLTDRSSVNEGADPAYPSDRTRRPMTSPNTPTHMKLMPVGQSAEFISGSHSSEKTSANGSHASYAISPTHLQLSQSMHGATDGLSISTASLSTSVSYNKSEHGSSYVQTHVLTGDNHAHPTRHLQEKAWQESDSPVEHLSDGRNKLSLPLEGPITSPRASLSTVSNYHTASNTPIIPDDENRTRDSKSQALPLIHTEIEVERNAIDANNDDTTILAVNEEPTAEDRQHAQKIFDEFEDETEGKESRAAWLGSPDRSAVRKAYMELFDWSNMNILAALRGLCGRLALKGETQQVDRILDAFSSRWCECNLEHGFKATDVVHTICYSLLLLNTDLHMADIEQKMTRSQFIKNTMPTIQRVVLDAAPNAFERTNPGNASSKAQPPGANVISGALIGKSPTLPPVRHGGHGSVDMDVPHSTLSKPTESTPRTNSLSIVGTSQNTDVSSSDSGPLVSTPFRGTQKGWEFQIESVLRDFYNSIHKQRLPLRGATVEAGEPHHPSNNFLTLTGNMLRRTPSTLSKSGSDICPRGRHMENRLSTARWSSKPRSRPRLYPSSNIGSSRTSLDDQSSVWSPSASSTWSKHSLGKTLTSMSMDSLGSDFPRGDYQQSIGFANALSHAIIREDSANAMSGMEDSERAAALLEDETLELAGAPWAKEGSLKHKHHLDSVDKRSKDRNWNESFAVIQRGWMRLFSFNASTKSMRLKPKQRQNGGLVVGGGNWTENAEETWKFLLRQSIASALPSPGYSKSRPHVWALSLPTGAVHLFQVGTPEIVKEFVSSANYWSARLSKEPLFGGISNIEYGWSPAVINSALVHNSGNGETTATGSSSTSGPQQQTAPPPQTANSSATRQSFQSSFRGSLDHQSSVRPRLPADRIHISDWTPPQQSMMASTLSENDQLATLRRYVKHVEEELQRHNELRGAMSLAFTPRHPNANKALANWERKSSYLLREIVKFRTYIDCLTTAQTLREKIRAVSAGTNGNGAGTSTETPTALHGLVELKTSPIDRPRASSLSVS